MPRIPPPLQRYGSAALSVALALLLTLLAPPLRERAPFSLFFGAVVISAWHGGRGPGLLATALSALAVDYWILPPHFSLLSEGVADLVPLSVFVLVAMLVSSLTAARQRAEKAAQEEQRRCRLLVESSLGLICTHDLDGALLSINPAAAELLGYQPEEMIGKNLRELLAPQVRHLFPEYLERIRRNPTDSGLLRVDSKDGTERIWLYRNVRYEEPGKPTYVLGHAQDATELHQAKRALQKSRDELEIRVAERTADLERANEQLHAEIAERRRAEEVLEASERSFRALFESALDAVLIVDNQRRVVEANPAACRLLGLSRKEFLGRCFDDFLAPAGTAAECAVEPMWQAFLQQSAQIGEVRLFLPDGTARDVDYRARASFLPGRHLSTMRDVTERKQAEEALRESERHYRLLFETNPHPMWVFDRVTLGFLAVNDAAIRHYGYSREEFLAMTIKDIRPPEDIPRLLDCLEANRPRHEGAGVWRHRKRDGTIIEVEVTSHEIAFWGRDARLVLAHDVTEHRHLEEELRQFQKMEAVGRLAGGVAHDFNNLLTAILGYSEVLLEAFDPADPLRAEVDEIKKAGERAAALTRQLLAFSRKQVLQPTVLDLNLVVADLEKMLGRLIGEDLELVTVAGASPALVKADGAQIEQVILNLALNARDAMPRGGRLTIETATVELDDAFVRRRGALQPGPHVMLAVSDTGVGMDVETRSHLFEPFFTTKGQGQGTGLGLSTTYGIVRQSGGDIEVDSEPGRGTSLRIYLPLAKEPPDPTGPQTLRKRPAARPATVLLVEDEQMVHALVRQILQRNGYTVLEAHDGHEALLRAEEHPGHIDLLLTDVIMPAMSGPELFQRLSPSRPAMKALYMSGHTDEAIVSHGVLVEGKVFLPKPFTTERLMNKIREVLAPAG